jgi:hypothetical protein
MTSLDPVLWPEIEGPEFVRSSDVAAVAEAVLSEHGKAGGVPRVFDTARAIRDGEIHVLWLLNDKPFDELNEEKSHDAAGKCLKAPRLWHDVTGFDLAIWIRGYFWRRAEPRVRQAMLLHELLHVEIRRTKENEAKVSIRKHDVEDFVDVVRHYGPIFGYAEGGARGLVKAAQLWDERTAKPDEEDLRPKGEVNPAALRGEVERASRPKNGGPQTRPPLS